MSIASKPKKEAIDKVRRSNKAVVILSDPSEKERRPIPRTRRYLK
tara:strand:+ start:2176 stop:2310 length:135 start_codon:yes stop_codon:yes gene_type:complete